MILRRLRLLMNFGLKHSTNKSTIVLIVSNKKMATKLYAVMLQKIELTVKYVFTSQVMLCIGVKDVDKGSYHDED